MPQAAWDPWESRVLLKAMERIGRARAEAAREQRRAEARAARRAAKLARRQAREEEARAMHQRFKDLRSGKIQPTAIVARPGVRRVPTR